MEPLRELSTLIARHAVPEACDPGPVTRPGLSLRMTAAAQAPTPRVYEPTFGLVVQGRKQVVLGDQVFTCGHGAFMLVSVDLPVTFHIQRATAAQPYLALALTLQPAAIASLLLEVASTEPAAAPRAGLSVSEAGPALLEAVVRLVRLLDHPRDLPVLAPLAEKEILWRLLCSDQGPRLRQIGLADGRLAQVGRAMRWMRQHYREPQPIEDLARVAAMSVTSFHRHFRAVALMSPLQYLKQIRLQEARARLLAHDLDVAAVGHAVGYDSPSQFSREYKRAYGAPPGEDARLLRATQLAK